MMALSKQDYSAAQATATEITALHGRRKRDMSVIIVAEHGTHLLISQGERFAVVERRNNKLYSCQDGKRDGIPLDDLPKIASILNRSEWTDRTAAQAKFDEVVARGTDLAQRML